jgi:hypothetical protein
MMQEKIRPSIRAASAAAQKGGGGEGGGGGALKAASSSSAKRASSEEPEVAEVADGRGRALALLGECKVGALELEVAVGGREGPRG